MMDLKETTHAFVEDEPTLDMSLTAAENATAIHGQITATLADVCPSITPTRNALSASVSVVFDECTLPGGVTVSGQVTASVRNCCLGCR